jgi:hypothetical protein
MLMWILNSVEEGPKLLSGSENSGTNAIKLTVPIHTALIFKEQAKVKGSMIMRQGIIPTSLLNTNY